MTRDARHPATMLEAARAHVRDVLAQAGLDPEAPPPATDIDVRGVITRLSSTGLLEERWSSSEVEGLILCRATAEEVALVNPGLALAYSLHSELVVGMCRRFSRGAGQGSPADEFVTGAGNGERIGCVATTEDHTGSNLSMVQLHAARAGGRWCLRGAKRYTTSGDIATDAVVLAATEHGPTLFLVDLDDPGVHRSEPFSTMGMEPSNAVRLELDVVLDDRRRLGPPGAGLLIVSRFLRMERLVAGLTSARLATESVLLARQFLIGRQGPGGPLIESPAIRHRVAAGSATAASLAAHADQVFERAVEGTVTDLQVAELKLVAARGACSVIDDMIQLLGGRGYTEHFPLSTWWRAARLMRIGGGTDEVMLEIIAAGLPAPSRAALLDHCAQLEARHLYPGRAADAAPDHLGAP